jgi:hypothetical protein
MTTFRGPVATQLFRWTSIKHQLKLEAAGLRSSGGAIRPRIAAELGLKPRDAYVKYQVAIELKIVSLKSQLESGDITE